jgi:hypothetical protein
LPGRASKASASSSVGVGEMLADVAEPGRAEQGVDHRTRRFSTWLQPEPRTAHAPRRGGVRTSIRDRAHETKASWKSVEFWATVVLVVPSGRANRGEPGSCPAAWVWSLILSIGLTILLNLLMRMF